MNNVMPVRFSKGFSNIFDEFERLRKRQFTITHKAAERLPVNPLHNNVRLTLLRLAVVVDGRDMGVRESREGMRLTQESRAQVLPVRTGCVSILQELNGSAPPQERVLGEVDSAHATLAELIKNAVLRNGLPDQRCPLIKAKERRSLEEKSRPFSELALRTARDRRYSALMSRSEE